MTQDEIVGRLLTKTGQLKEIRYGTSLDVAAEWILKLQEALAEAYAYMPEYYRAKWLSEVATDPDYGFMEVSRT